MFGLIQSGGLIMIPLLACSVIACAIVAERCWYLRPSEIVPPNLAAEVESHLARLVDNPVAVDTLSRHSLMGKVLASCLAKPLQSAPELESELSAALDQAAHTMERYLTALEVIAAVTPLLGILGTMVGMIDVFSTVVQAQSQPPEMLAGGISTALVTSAVGLTIAIPSLTCHRFLVRRVDAYLLEIEAVGRRVIDLKLGRLLDTAGNAGPTATASDKISTSPSNELSHDS